MSTYRIVRSGDSRSFPSAHAFVDNAQANGAARVFLGAGAGKAFSAAGETSACPFVAIELGTECLGVHTGESAGTEGSNVVGFARFRLGKADPTPLVELVRQPNTRAAAIAAARAAFESRGPEGRAVR